VQAPGHVEAQTAREHESARRAQRFVGPAFTHGEHLADVIAGHADRRLTGGAKETTGLGAFAGRL
jgi:hypothetical protein